MSETATLPPEFELAMLSLRGMELPARLEIAEIPAPPRMAPFAFAVSGHTQSHDQDDRPLGSGKLVVLYDPDEQPGWDGRFRLIAMIAAPIETELGTDPLAGQVIWSWLRDSLQQYSCSYTALVGTVTTQISDSFGGLELAGSEATVELRASWSPQDPNLSNQISAWAATLLLAAGLDPAENVTQLRS